MGVKFADLRQQYADLWNTMIIREDKKQAVAADAATITAGEARYREVSAKTGVPWQVIGILHSLESGCKFDRHLHNGNSLQKRTVDRPSGRPPTGEPPFEWEVSAVDALKFKDFDAIKNWPVEMIAFVLETNNGMGHQLVPSRGHSPYLWSFTNHYTKGKFESDGNFNPQLVSQQSGGMALLKQLGGADISVQIQTTAPSAAVATKVVPLETGLFFASGPFELLPTATAGFSDATNADLIEEDEPVRKLGEVGTQWNIEVLLRGGGTRRGFARGGIFKPQSVDSFVDPEVFAQLCLDAARLNKTSAHHLIAWADLETGIRNVAAEKGDGAGPFLIGADDWAAATVDKPALATARFDPMKQPFVAAKMTVDATAVLQLALPDKKLPSSAELFLASLLGPAKAKDVLANRDAPFQAAVVQAAGLDKANILHEVRPWLFDGIVRVSDALEKIALAMDLGYVRADALFRKVEPDIEIATAPATGFAGRLIEKASAEWTFFGEQTRNLAGALTKAGHKEDEARVPPGSGEDWFARVGTYWREGTGRLGLDGRSDKPWSAAFISYVVKIANPAGRFHFSARHSEYISRAISDCADKVDAAGYWCKRLNEHQPKMGDIICWAREAGVDYDHQKGGDYDGHCDIVVAIRVGEIDVIGGNVGNSVTKRTFACDADGFVKGGSFQGETLFAIMENRIP